MMIRAFKRDDLIQIKRIHEKHYREEFDLPNFEKMICAFSVVKNDRIIVAGGIRSIAEVITLTDKDLSFSEKSDALFEVLDASVFIGARAGYSQLHAFVQNPVWCRFLRKAGFENCVGKALFLQIGTDHG